MPNLSGYIQAARPKTLTASISPVIVGSAIAYNAHKSISVDFFEDPLNNFTLIFLCTLFSAMFLQIASNLFNDAIDFDKGSDTNERFGPKRVTQSGIFTSSQVKRAGLLCIIIAVCFGIPLVIKGGLPILAVGLSAAFFSWAYTGGPYPLAYNGLGELFVLIYYGIVAVVGTFYLQTLSWNLTTTLPYGIAVGSFGMALIGLNNFRDIYQDRRASKKTLAVRYGEGFSKLSIICFLVIPYIITAIFLNRDSLRANPSTLLFSIPLIISALIIIQLYKSQPSEKLNSFLGKIALNQLIFCLITSIYLVLRTATSQVLP